MTAPRVTTTAIEAEIASEHYFTAAQGDEKARYDAALERGMIQPGESLLGWEPLMRLTFCVLRLRNGYTVTGQSACVSPENFDAEIGRKIARENAIQQMWPLMGFLLAERLYQERKASEQAAGAFTHADVARITHEANRALCEALGDTSQEPWIDAPHWQKSSAVDGVLYHLRVPDAGPEASHENWMAQKDREGWTWGREKDPGAKTHPCMVPYDLLPPEQRAKDHLFRAIVHALRPFITYA